LPNCEDFVGEWAINKDRQRMVAEFSNLITDRRKLIEELKKL